MPNEHMQAFFHKRRKDGAALTFDDVLLIGNRAKCAPWEVDLSTRFSRNVKLNLPIVGAAMSTVTEAKMAIALAKMGGIGSIHRILSPENQAKEVGRVKHHQHGFIDEPKTVYPYETVAQLLAKKAEKEWKFDSFPVVERGSNKLLGIITRTDIKRCDDYTKRIDQVMTPIDKMITAREGVDMHEAYRILKESDKNVLPIIKSEGTLVGIYTFSDLKRMIAEKTIHNMDHGGKLRVCAAVGVGEEALERAERLVAQGVDVLHIDMANAWQDYVFTTARALKEKYPDGPDVVLGNFIRPEAVSDALHATKVDGILVGMGGGSICTTRVVTGTGLPQVTAVYECAMAAAKLDVPVCSDGGIRYTGDIAIALAAGAESVMVGGLVAGTEEAPGEKRKLADGSYVKEYYGMGSERAMKESSGARQRYLQGQGRLIPEGVEGVVPYKDAVTAILELQKGGLEKAFHSNGARTIMELHEKARFTQVTSAGHRESHVHDVSVEVQASNYR